MEKILELSDSYNAKYPQHFQTFLDNCVEKYIEHFGPNDYLFAAVYFIILEAGFSPVESTRKLFGSDSVYFDLRKLSSISCYSDSQIKISNNLNKPTICVYRISLKLGNHSSSLCELQGVPSTEGTDHVIINFFLKTPHTIRSLCLNTESYIERNEPEQKHKYSIKNLKQLSMLLKNKMVLQIKDIILVNEEERCSANLLCLPEEIQKKIIYKLKNDPTSLQSLGSTCSYFYSLISKDTKLWEEICFNNFSGQIINKFLQEASFSGDTNIFRTTFLKLKIKQARKYI